MSEETIPTAPLVAWCKLFHPSGIDVRIPLPVESPDALLRMVAAYISTGWLTDPPQAEAGETIEEIGYVARREFESRKDGSLTPVVDLYGTNDAMTFRILSVYLNSAQDHQAFEAASGLKLAAIPLLMGNSVERGKSRQTDQFIVRAPKPFKLGMKVNPKYDAVAATAAKAQGQVYKVPRRLFTRWPGVAPQEQTTLREPPPNLGVNAMPAGKVFLAFIGEHHAAHADVWGSDKEGRGAMTVFAAKSVSMTWDEFTSTTDLDKVNKACMAIKQETERRRAAKQPEQEPAETLPQGW